MKRTPNPALWAEHTLAVWVATAQAAGPTSMTAHCKLLTPMYGGGVKPGNVDRELPIRPSALRGQLRFWWRLLYDAGRPSSDAFREESELWGGISSAGPRASLVTLQVGAAAVASDRLLKARSRNVIPDYTLILEKGDNPDLLEAGYEFTLTLRFTPKATPAQRRQVVEALRWWASFGGVGARTRRGLGAVAVRSDEPAVQPVSCREVEARGGRMVLRPGNQQAIEAWREAITALKDFRQGPDLGRNPGSSRNRPGRSRWPEPDAIRRLTRENAPGHEPKHPVDGYPRAAFGLPIVFHFKDDGDPKGPKGKGMTLIPKAPDRENTKAPDRMASPLILRPYFDGARYWPLALLLPGWEQRVSVPVGFETGSANLAWPHDPGEREQKAARIEPMSGRGTDALSAFMHYFEHQGRTPQRRGGR